MRYLGWVIFAVIVVLVAIEVVLLTLGSESVLSYEVLVQHAFPWVPLGSLVGSAVGALIIWRYPRNVVGWLLCIGGLGSPVAMVSYAFATVVYEGLLDAPGLATAANYVSSLFDASFTISFLAVIFMIVPDGRFLSPRWKYALVLPFLAVVCRWSAVLALPPDAFLEGRSSDVSQAVVVLLTMGGVAVLISVLLGATALWLRLRRSTGTARQQLRWIVTSACILAASFTLVGIVELFTDDPPWLPIVALYLSYIFVLVAIGVAVLRYRLYDIDVILSRAIVLGVLALFVTIGYVVVVVAIGTFITVTGSFGSRVFWPSLVAIALVAVAFQPLRRHVLQLADRLVYGNRAAPYEALAELSRRLADSPSPDSLPDRVAAAAGRAVGAACVAVSLRGPADGSPVRVARWTDRQGLPGDGIDQPRAERVSPPVIRLPVSDMGEQVGSIEVTMPPGRALRTFERTLLDDVAAQAGVAFRNALLEAELEVRVTEGEQRSADLAASRRRLVGVEDEARERLAAAINRSVVPHLTAVENGLAACADAGPGSLGERLTPLIAETERALEELRTVVRGVYPALLERRGLAPALAARLDITHGQAVLDIDDDAAGRLDRAVEAAAYVFCTEVAPTDRPCVVRLRVDRSALTADITAAGAWADGWSAHGGRGGEPPNPDAAIVQGPGWQHALDRVAALDGEIRVFPQEEEGSVTVSAVIPVEDQARADPETAAQTTSSRSGPNADLGTYAAAPQSVVRSANSASS